MDKTVDNCGKNGYIIMKSDYPQDKEMWKEDEYDMAVETMKIMQKEDPKARFYIREVTDHEVYQAALRFAASM